MASLIREERYLFRIGTEEHILRVQELIWGGEAWPEPFRIEICASGGHKAAKFYGTSAREVVEMVAEYLSSATERVAGIMLRLDQCN
jgi:phenylacetate-coenzyme A ligase PaaK-like adenylate-forming protein